MKTDSAKITNRFAIVIPAYNHGGTVAEVIRKTSLHGYPVIVVDDGSTDDTADNIASFQDIKILRHPHNQGKGAALITGMAEAAKVADWAVCLDADGQHDPAEMAALIRAIPAGQRPIVIGRRKMMDAAPWTSRFGRKFSNFWVWISSGVYLNDTQSGFRIYPLPEALDLDVRSRRYQYEVEVLAKAAWNGIAIVEAPIGVSYSPGGKRISHFHPWRDFNRNSRTFCRLIVRRVFSPKLWRPGRQPTARR